MTEPGLIVAPGFGGTKMALVTAGSDGGMAGGGYSVRPRRPAGDSGQLGPARRGADAIAYCGQHPPREGRGAITRARSSGGLVSGRRLAGTRGASPRQPAPWP